MANQIYFTADLHFGHTNILKHSPNRPYSDTVDIQAHDEWLLDLWRNTVDKRDTIYILGDLTFLKSEDARHLLEKLPGHKFLIEGNHDGSIRAYKHYFREVYQIMPTSTSSLSKTSIMPPSRKSPKLAVPPSQSMRATITTRK